MSTDLPDRTRQPSPGEGPDQHDAPKSSLSIAQIVGGALAAMTAAALGSRLSLVGTVVGAAFASIIAAVAGSIYTASLRRTSQRVSTVIARVRPMSGAAASPSAGATAATPSTTVGTRVEAAPGWVLPADPAGSTTPSTQRPPTSLTSGSTIPGSTTPGHRSRLGWKQVLLGALLMFLVAALLLTGLELATGRALSGGNGTTVGQVADPGTRPSSTPTRSASPTPSATPSATASATPSTTPSATPSSGPTAGPTPAASAAPSSTPTSTPTSSPAPSVSPSAATPAS